MAKAEADRKALEILADAVDRTVGTGFVHAAVVKAANTLAEIDRRQAGKAFDMLNPRETRKVRSTAIESAELFRQFGDIDDPVEDFLVVVDQIHLIDREHHVLDAEA